jgi:excisionase family DNA binding protein
MNNPFEVFDNRLSNIEKLLLDLKNHPIPETSSEAKEMLFSIKEAAKFLNLSVPTIYGKVRKGELPFMKRSKRLYFSSLELTAYLKEGRVKTNKEIESDANSYLANN